MPAARERGNPPVLPAVEDGLPYCGSPSFLFLGKRQNIENGLPVRYNKGYDFSR